MTNGCFAVYRNVFALIVAIDDYEGETYLQTKRATYKDIRTWVKKALRPAFPAQGTILHL